MESSVIKKYLGKNVRVTTNNRFSKVGILVEVEDTHLVIQKGNGQEVTIMPEYVLLIETAKKKEDSIPKQQ